MKNILGLDLGTNSIGWALVNAQIDNDKEQLSNIEACGSRIIPMDAATLGDFDKGNTKSQTADRTSFRGARRLRERHLLRRERLHRVLDLIGFLPKHYSESLTRYGKFVGDAECKLAWAKDETGVYQFLFEDSFREMLADFTRHQPELVSDGKKVPYDWTIYYLRKKALTQKIAKEELAWILLNFNQKRGYYQLRGEEEEVEKNKDKTFEVLKVDRIEDSGEKIKEKVLYDVYFDNGWKYDRQIVKTENWIGKTKEFIVTTTKTASGEIKRTFKAVDSEKDWIAIKQKTEQNIEISHKTVGTYIYDTLLQKPNQKIIGKLVRTIERKYYKDELCQILEIQSKFHPELQDRELYAACLDELYPNNEPHKNNIVTRNLCYLLIEDIIFYQRPLKSKKSLIDNCPYEGNNYVDKDTGEIEYSPKKCIAKSHPLYQEFRLWQFLYNLRIYEKEKYVTTSEGLSKSQTDVDVTAELLKTEADYVALFDWLNDKEKIKQETLLGYKPFALGKNSTNYRWNYVEDKPYPCNETRAQILARLKKADIPETFLTKEKEEGLWHILYSVDDKHELEKALHSFAKKNELNEVLFVEQFRKFPPFKKDYGAYSAKAIKKLLPLMRRGKYWSYEAIDKNTQNRIDKIITGEYDENIRDRVREKAIDLTERNHFCGLPLWLACYVVYDRHSEMKDITKWEKPEDIDAYLKSFKQHSLRNPIVEQVVLETLRVVRDIWKQAGHIDEIHVELGREMKNPADKRKKMTERMLQNENTNLRIKALLTEFLNSDFEIENVRPFSPSQQDLLRIYEEGVLEGAEVPDDIQNILSKFKEADIKKRPTHSEVLRYKCWLDQKYCSPYTGEIIPLSKLFTTSYEIEHIIPQSRYFDDSFSNKVICEDGINKLKGQNLGYEFIKKFHGEKVDLGQDGKVVEVLSVEEYEERVKKNYSHNRAKMQKLLMEDIPDAFIARQLNDSRYISKVVKSLLSNIVREKDEQEAISKNVIPCTGGITDRLKKDWGINNLWKKLMLPRFERMNKITKSEKFTTKNKQGHIIPNCSISQELLKSFQLKRIDHRHHAMDALVIACATRKHIQYLNNENAKSQKFHLQKGLAHKLRKFEEEEIEKWRKNNDGIWEKSDEKERRKVPKEFFMPWDNFVGDAETALQNIIVSFKQNLRVINKTTNYYQHYDDNKGKKVLTPQLKGDSWAIRKPMHKDTVFAEVNLRKIKTVSLKEALNRPKSIVNSDLKKKILAMLELKYDSRKIKKYFEENKDVWDDVNLSKIEVYYFTKETKERYFATRYENSLINIFSKIIKAKIKENEKYDKSRAAIRKITDTGIQKILLKHLKENDNNPVLAFSPEGLDKMNENIKKLNNGRAHKPIYKVRVYEQAEKFAVGQTGNKKTKFVEAAKGTNLFFAIYESEILDEKTNEVVRKRIFSTIPLNIVIDRQKQGLSSVPEEDENGNKLKFSLSPTDLVYLPTEEEIRKGEISQPINKNRIYKFIDSSGIMANFVLASTAALIFAVKENESEKYNNIKNEYGLGSPQSKNQRAITGEMIKEICVPLKVDRLGNIIQIGDLK